LVYLQAYGLLGLAQPLGMFQGYAFCSLVETGRLFGLSYRVEQVISGPNALTMNISLKDDELSSIDGKGQTNDSEFSRKHTVFSVI
jgi:hypothetical protein